MPRRCAFGCINTDVVMHVFPKPDKFPERFKAWVDLLGGKPDTMSDLQFYNKKRICDIHFNDEQRVRNNRLSALAYPTLHLPDNGPQNIDESIEEPSSSPEKGPPSKLEEMAEGLPPADLPEEDAIEELPSADVHEEDAMHIVDDPNIEPVSEVVEDPLQELGDSDNEAQVYGPEINSTLAKCITKILKKGLNEKVKEKLFKKYNDPLFRAPSLNPEIAEHVTEIILAQDRKMQAEQDQLGVAIEAINRAMSVLLATDDKEEAIKLLLDSLQIICDLHYNDTQERKKLATPGLAIIDEEDRDETLFGDIFLKKSGLQKRRVIRASRKNRRIRSSASAPQPSTSTNRN